MKVLLAEDCRPLAAAIGRALCAEGYEVDIVYDGYQALDKLNDAKYDYLLIESGLPRLCGAEVLAKSKKQGYAPRSIGILPTSYYQVAQSACFDVVLPKPFGVDELLTALRRLVETRGVESYGALTVDMSTMSISYKDKAVPLTLPEIEVARLIVANDEPVSADTLAEVPLSGIEGGVYRLISYINSKLKKGGLAMRFVAVADKGYRVNYD